MLDQLSKPSSTPSITTVLPSTEEEVSGLFPAARVARLDLDSAKSGYETILDDFQEGRTDILIGTQMVSKGLDFDRVSVVGIVQADSILSYPDYHATERGYQLMAQVAGRAGRKDRQGTVIIQTRQPDAPVMEFVSNNNYAGFFRSQMEERHAFCYPPYSRIVTAILKGHDPESVQHIRRIMVKISLDLSVEESRQRISQALQAIHSGNGISGVTVSFDADPQ